VPLDDSDEEKINTASNPKEVVALKDFVVKLQQEVKRRDNEIAILIQHLNKVKGTSSGIPVTTSEEGDDLSVSKKMTFYQMMTNKQDNDDPNADMQSHTTGTTAKVEALKTTTQRVEEMLQNDNNLIGEVKLDKEDMVDKAKAFEKFRKSYRRNQAMEENKAILKERMIEGKQTGMQAKDIKDEMKHITGKIEELRQEKVMQGQVDDEGNIMNIEEDELQTQLQFLKGKYQEKYNQLKVLKAEIDRLRNQIDRCWKQLQKDFEDWYRMYPNKEAKNPLEMTSDKNVQDDLKAFYKAKEQIYNHK
jgi:hypothetical protein